MERGSVCGTDLHIYNWDDWAQKRVRPPLIIGHEFAGTITEVASDVQERCVGQFVASESHIVPLDDPYLQRGEGHVAPSTVILGVDRDGGFAPEAVIPWSNARPTPESISREVASFQDALGNAVHTVMSGPVEGQTLLITGMGPIGLFSVAVAKALGAKKVFVTEVSEFRKDLAHQLGADAVLDPTQENVGAILQREFPEGVDGTLEMSGHPSSLDLALEHTRPGGRVSLLGVYAQAIKHFEVNTAIFKGLQIHGIVGRKLWETWEQMQWLLTERGLDVSPVITHQMPYTEIEAAMQLLKAGKAGKIVLHFDNEG